MKRLLTAHCFFISLTAYSPSGFCDQNLFDLSLKQLLSIHVKTASKQKENLIQSPSSITRYSNKQIRQLGYFNLAELANITPAFSSYTNIGEITLETRAQKAGGFDNHRHLLLLDGIGINHIRANTYIADNRVPLYFAQSVEFVRGPASALYGVGAFYGVTQIQPSQAARNTTLFKSDLNISAGSHDNETRVLGNVLSNQSEGFGGISFAYYQKDDARTQADTTKAKNYDREESYFTYGRWHWDKGVAKGLTLGLLHNQKTSGLGNFWANYSHPNNEIFWRDSLVYTKFEKSLGSGFQSRSHVKYHLSEENASYFNESGNLNSSYTYPFINKEAQTEVFWQASENQNVVAGLHFDTRHGDASEAVVNNNVRYSGPSPKLKTHSFYLQYKARYALLSGLNLTAGFREDHGDQEYLDYSQFSPRLALVQSLTDDIHFKIQYGKALRGASLKELGVNSEVLSENPGLELNFLKPETISSIEFVLRYDKPGLNMSATYFKNRTENHINRNWENLGEYINTPGKTRIHGLEIEAQYFPKPSQQILFNFSLANPLETVDSTHIDTPKRKANISWLWNASSRWKGALTLRWTDEFFSLPPSMSEGFTVMDANIRYRINRHFTAGLKLVNLFNENYELPLQGDPNVKMPGSSVLLNLEFSNGD